jgi:hypothetical protein
VLWRVVPFEAFVCCSEVFLSSFQSTDATPSRVLGDSRFGFSSMALKYQTHAATSGRAEISSLMATPKDDTVFNTAHHKFNPGEPRSLRQLEAGKRDPAFYPLHSAELVGTFLDWHLN